MRACVLACAVCVRERACVCAWCLTSNLALSVSVLSPTNLAGIVLQVLLSQLHRLRALKLLAEFLDLGDWATNMSLSVGIHAYVILYAGHPV